MPPEHRDIGGSCSVPPDEIFTFSAGTSSKSPVEPTVVRPGLCVATGIKLRRRREVWCGVATGSNGIRQRILKMKILRSSDFSISSPVFRRFVHLGALLASMGRRREGTADEVQSLV